MSPVEEFIPDPGRDLRPLLRALEPHGGDLTFTSWASVPGMVTVHLHLPENEYRERKCRQLIAQWRAGTLHDPS